jgi:hypothetical protein
LVSAKHPNRQINKWETKLMKVFNTKSAETPQTPVFQIAIRKRVAKHQAATPSPKPEKRDNIFSKSRDTHEDRGTREIKTTHNPQTFFHICALL